MEEVGNEASVRFGGVGVSGAKVEERVVEIFILAFTLLLHSVIVLYILAFTLLVHLVVVLFILGFTLLMHPFVIIFILGFRLSVHSFKRGFTSLREVRQGDPSKVSPLPP